MPGSFITANPLHIAALTGAMMLADAPRLHAVVPDQLGVMTHFAQNWSLALAPEVADAGINHVRDELYWQQIEPEPGKFVFPSRYENYMAALAHDGISPLIALTFANSNYDDGLTPHTPAAMQAYARYANAVLDHYGDEISAVEIWNEYNGSFCTGPATSDRSGTYTRMLETAYHAIKARHPDVTVAGGATAGLPLPYLERLFAAGALDSMDAVSIHPYRTDSAPEGIEDEIAALQKLIARYNHGKTKPIWVTEIGWGTHEPTAPGDIAIDEDTQAAFLVRSFALLLSAGVDRVYWYLLKDYQQFDTMGLVRSKPPFAPKPAYLALSTFTDQLRDATFVARENTDDSFYSLLFRRASGREVRVIWSLAPTTIAAPHAETISTTTEKKIAPTDHLAISDQPVFVVGSLQVPAPSHIAAKPLANALAGFSDRQSQDGWSYGVYLNDKSDFHPLEKFQITDWKAEWTGKYPYISITARDQHPSASGDKPIAAVRRWTSDIEGSIEIRGHFKCGTGGDGVRVRILADGAPIFERSLGGGEPLFAAFDLSQPVHRGTCLDFAVDPGPAAHTDFDVTKVTVTLSPIQS